VGHGPARRVSRRTVRDREVRRRGRLRRAAVRHPVRRRRRLLADGSLRRRGDVRRHRQRVRPHAGRQYQCDCFESSDTCSFEGVSCVP
jgi:hypothetical protein